MGSGPIEVRGGSAGIVAQSDDLTGAAGAYLAVAGATLEDAVSTQAMLFLGTNLGSTALDPAGAARIEASLFEVTDGPTGLNALAARCTVLAAALRLAAAEYSLADRLDTTFEPIVGALTHLPRSVTRGLDDVVHDRFAQGVQDLIASDPELAALLIDHVDGPASAAQLANLYPDGHARVTAQGIDAEAARPPRTLTDVLSGLARRDGGEDGEIDVRILAGTTPGRRRVIVDIPGTKDWDVTRRDDPDVVNMGTNLRALDGEQTTYEQGVLSAMRQAGVRPDDDVLLVGHSLGGMVAVNTATAATASGEFHVSNVITAGSPIATDVTALPKSVQVLALENSSDVVPQLDGRPNPARPNVTTVTVHPELSGVGANHGLDTAYVPAAADVEASADPSVRSFLDGIGGFLNADKVTTHRYVISRAFT